MARFDSQRSEELQRSPRPPFPARRAAGSLPRAHVLLATLTLLALAGCSRRTTVPKSMSGSYEHEPASLLALVTDGEVLNVTESGAELAPRRQPAGGQGGQGGQGATHDRFSRVTCAVPDTCTFSTAGGCEGTIERQGDVLLVLATGRCSVWSGRWGRAHPSAPMFP